MESLHSELLSSVKIKLTSRCNLRCQMCDYWKNKTETALTTEQWLDVIDQLADFGCKKIHFSGGEVFLRKDFLDLVERACQRGIKTNMTTNGTLFTKDRIRRLVRAKPNSVSLSLDGPRAKLHDSIRGLPGSFKRTTRTIAELKKVGGRYGRTPKIRINFVLMQENYRKAAEMVTLASELGVTELHPMPIDEGEQAKFRLTKSQIRRYNKEVAPLVYRERRKGGFSTLPQMVFPFGRTKQEIKRASEGEYGFKLYESKPCLSPWNHLFIGWDGETYLCCMTNTQMSSLGNVAEQSVPEIFNGEPMKQIRRDFRALHHHPACAKCDMVIRENQVLHSAIERFKS